MRKQLAGAAIILSATVAPAHSQPDLFTVNVSGFTAPNGQPWTARGMNVDLGDALQNLQGIVQNFPGTTFVRVVCNANTDTLANIDPVVQAYTSKGIVVELEDHSDSQSGNNTSWYTMLASAYKNNPLVFLETPNEPSDLNTAQHQINIIQAIRAAGDNSPIGVQLYYGPNGESESNLSQVVAAVGANNFYAAPHIYGSPWQQSAIDGAKADGLFSVIDEFGNGMNGVTADAQGQAVVDAVVAANKAGLAGAAVWAAGNGYHRDGVDSLFLDPTGSQLTSLGQYLQSWLSGSSPTALVNYTSNADGVTANQGQQAVSAASNLSVAAVARLASQGQTADGQSVGNTAAAAWSQQQRPSANTESGALSGANGAANSAAAGDVNPAQPITLSNNAPTGTMPPPAPATGSVAIDASGTDQTITEPAGNGTGTISGTGNSVTALGGIQTLDITGIGNTVTTGPYNDVVTVEATGNVIDLGGGNNTITLKYKNAAATDLAALSPVQIDRDAAGFAPLTPAGNVFVAPQPGMGVLTIEGAPLAKGDEIDLTKALAGIAGWDHQVADIPQFVTVSRGTTGVEIGVGGRTVVVLASGVSHGSILQHLVAK